MRAAAGNGQRFCRRRGAAAREGGTRRAGGTAGLPAAPHHVPGDEDGAG